MRRTERLFRIIQTLRGARQPVLGRDLARDLEVSLRTLYRDMAELTAQRVPIRGEAGAGYVLDEGYDLPPLMLTPDELEAAVLGASWVAARGDRQLAQGARDLVAKLTAVVPRALRPVILDAGLRPMSFVRQPVEAIDIGVVRHAIRDRTKLKIAYADAQDNRSERVIWPILIAYMEQARIVVTFCETREDFRHFRTDRLLSIESLGLRYPASRQTLLKDWKAHLARDARCAASSPGLADAGPDRA